MILVSTISKIIPLHICPEVALLDHMVLLTEGNGNPLQCSCLENPRDGGARWAAVYGVAQSWTRLKRLSSSIVHGGCKESDTTDRLSLYVQRSLVSFSPWGHKEWDSNEMT